MTSPPFTGALASAPAQGWQLYAAALSPTAALKTTTTCRLEIALTDDHQDGTSDTASRWYVPSDAVAGLFRKDAFDKLHAMKPGFMRTPGGNYLEGTGQRTRWNWKATLGAPGTLEKWPAR